MKAVTMGSSIWSTSDRFGRLLGLVTVTVSPLVFMTL